MRKHHIKCANLVLLALVFVLVAAIVEADCRFGSITFNTDFNAFSLSMAKIWEYDYAPNLDLREAFTICQEKRTGEPERKYLSACCFRSRISSNFIRMCLYARSDVLYRVDFHFKERNAPDYASILKTLLNQNGKPSRKGRYHEELFEHNLVEWNHETCRIVYDYGGIRTQKPVYLIFEKLPIFQGRFSPLHVNLEVLK